MKRFASIFVLLFILCLALVSLSEIRIVKASETIFIRANGSVDPANAPIQRVGNIYTFTGYIDRIVVQRSNIIIDGNGHTLLSTEGASAVYLISVRNVTIKNMIIKNCIIGIRLDDSSYVTISGNTITETEMASFYPGGGIIIHGGGSNIIVGNNITNNPLGIYFGESSNNRIYHNNFINNEIQIYDPSWNYPYNAPSVNVWDDYPSGGNYWDDYTGVDVDDDGIGDTPYVIDENNQDNSPLMNPWGPPPPDTMPPTISIISPENKTYAVTDVPLTFTVNETASWIGYSLDGQANVTITGNTTLPELSYGSHNLTVYSNNTAGNMGYSETIYFTVAQPSEPSPIWIVAAIVIIAVVGAALLVYFKKIKKTTVIS